MSDIDDWTYPTLWSCIWYKEGKTIFSNREIIEHIDEYLSEYHLDSKFRWWLFWWYCDVSDFFFRLYLIKIGNGPYKSLRTGEEWGYWEYVLVFGIRNPILRMFWSTYDFVKYKVLRIEYVDPHIVCYSYPNCDEAPMGCHHVMGDDVEAYGHRD